MNDPASLENLHDIVVPTAVSLWPPAPGWYVLGAIALAALAWVSWRWVENWRKNGYRRAALAELSRLSATGPHPEQKVKAIMGLNELLKRTALAVWPRDEIAGLSGDQWLAFLDGAGGSSAFSSGPGRLLPSVLYMAPDKHTQFTDAQVAELMETARVWIKHHRAPEAK